MTDSFLPTVDEEAMQRHGSRKKPPTDMELNMTALIDVFFMLMLFFILGSRFSAAEGAMDSKLPQLGKGGGPVTPPIRVVITEPVRDEPRVTINGRPLKVDEVYDTMKAEAGRGALSSQVVVRPDKNVGWQHILPVYNAIKRAKFEDVRWGG